MERRHWTQSRRTKEPSLYDEYMKEERRTLQNGSQSPQIPAGAGPQSPMSIRPVTPDNNADDSSIVRPTTTQNFEREFLGLSASPGESVRTTSREHGSPRRSPMARRESADNTKREQPGSPKTSNRRRTMTFQSSSSDSKVPTVPSYKPRARLGSAQYPESLHSGANRASANGDGALASSVSQPAMSALPQLAQRASENDDSSSKRVLSGAPLPTPNARRILHLMKTLSGRMSGNVAFRKGLERPWTNVYCFIREAEGSLIYETAFGSGTHKTLIPDLRGSDVKCLVETETGTPYLVITVPTSPLEVHLRLSTQSDLDSWFAAILCWQPMQPKGMQNKLAKSQAVGLSAKSSVDKRPESESSMLKEAPVIKVGQMVYWDTDVTFGTPSAPRPTNRPHLDRKQSNSGSKQYGVRWWRRVSGQLRENGELKFYTEAENQLLTTLHLSQLSRSAVQRLDCSVLDQDNCIAIYPQYTAGGPPVSLIRPIFLSLETSVLFEVWFVLLRAFTIPQFYGPASMEILDGGALDSHVGNEQRPNVDMFRMERGLSISIVEARLQSKERFKNSPEQSLYPAKHPTSPKMGAEKGFYVEIHLDGETRGKTLVKNHDTNPFWSQELEYADLPAVLSSASVFVKHRMVDPASRTNEARFVHEAYGIVQEPSTSSATSGYTGITQDLTVGKVEIILDELDTQKRSESWWPIIGPIGTEVGTLLIRARAEETVILMRREYDELHKTLHTFDSGLTIAMFNAIPGELKRLSDSLVNIFQVSGKSAEWIMALIEDEIDGHGKDTPLSKARYNTRTADSDGNIQRGTDRELVVRDMNKNAALEANLLFRGNTLLTKALDTHMRRVGAEYLADSLGGTIKSINDRDPDCEVDPLKVSSSHELSRNWVRLVATTSEVWNSIRTSAQKCPVELRFIFRHIKACAEDRYGDFQRTVSFSSVSGFLFLRFFCPAVLSPKLFGLLRDDPKPRAKRTFVLIAKSLQTMANMATFGSKEPWMEPMNSFLNSNRESFKRFIDEVCYVPHPPAALMEASPSYFTPNAIKNRLPIQNREGFPSLPYLLDEGREYANLVSLWLHAAKQSSSFSPERLPTTSPLRIFHGICKDLQTRTYDCLARAERAERPTSELSFRWEEIVDNLASNEATGPPRLDTNVPTAGNPPTASISALPDLATPLTPHEGSSMPSSPITPHRRAQQDWQNAPDGGAASAAASLLSQDRNPRSGFVIPSTSTSSNGLAIRPSPTMSAGAFAPFDMEQRRPGSASTATSTPVSASATGAEKWGVPAPPPMPGVESRPTSALSGRASTGRSESEGDTALPALGRRGKLRKSEDREREGRGVRDWMGKRRDRR